ncbi:MAG: hypothetical protein CVU46_10540 [Chloroflexi bacterium HGW-Chloroflexi-8]|nr:MAG: hypothetical protein CVU46_10540 [Chloroflexi bacterium HGW-Chloroflexi-8]
MPKAIESKAIKDVLENDFPVFWVYSNDWKRFQLIAITYTWENGNQRYRTVWRTSILNEAMKMHLFLVDHCKQYDAGSFQSVMEDNYWNTGEKADGLFTREWKNIPERK